MAKHQNTLAQSHPFLLYLFLAYAFSWLISVPLALSALHVIHPLPFWLHYLTAYGPMLAALVTLYITRGKQGIDEVIKSATNWRVGAAWYALAFSPLLIYMVAVVLGMAPGFYAVGKINFLPDISLLALPFWILNSGIGEEIGWRGFALPHLQKKYNPLTASLILGVVWFCWHIPFLLYIPNYLSLGPMGAVGLALGILSGAIVYTWVYNATNGSVFILILFHGVFNFITASQAGRGVMDAILSTAFIVAAVLLTFVLRKQQR